MKKKRLLAVVLAVTMTLGGAWHMVSADEIDELRQDQAAAETDLGTVNNNIISLENQKTELLGQIDSVDTQLVLTLASIDTLNAQIEDMNAQLAQTSADLEVAEENQAVEYGAMKKRIQYLYENGGNAGWATFLLEDKDITELLNQAEYTQKMYEYDRKCLEDYTITVQEVTSLKNQQEQEHAALVSMKNEQELQQQELEGILSELRATSSNYDEQLAYAQQMANEYRALIEAQNEQIRILEEAKARAAAEAAARAAAEAARQAEEARQAEAARAAQAAAEAAARAAAEADAAAAAEAAAAAQAAAAAAAAAAATNTYEEPTYTYYEEPAASYETPSYTEPSYSEPSYSEPAYSEPAYEEPSYSSSGGSAEGQAIANYALQFVGYPYVWGGNSLTNGTDCSGFVHLIYASFGYSVPRSSAAMPGAGYGVSYAEAQPGDIICYSGHCALYLGGGAIVHASDEATGIKISYDATYRPIIAVRRVVG